MGGSRPTGPLGVDPLHFSFCLLGLLLLFVFYLILPRGVRKQYFGAYPKRHAWSARTKSSSSHYTGGGSSAINGSSRGTGSAAGSSLRDRQVRSNYGGSSVGDSYAGSSQPSLNNDHYGQGGNAYHQQQHQAAASQYHHQQQHHGGYMQQQHHQQQQSHGMHQQMGVGQSSQQPPLLDLQQNDEIVISAAMQQLREPGVLIVAHGSRGKPKTVRLQLTESAITWRTETRKKGKDASVSKPKMGKLHQVPLSHIMYVDVGKQTTALRRVENASVSEALCFSLLTKEGSLDLEANSPRERDALVSCFSLVLDEVHAQNWRDIYRGPSSDMPSSFDELDRPDPNAQT